MRLSAIGLIIHAACAEALELALVHLGLPSVDLMLIHHPNAAPGTAPKLARHPGPHSTAALSTQILTRWV